MTVATLEALAVPSRHRDTHPIGVSHDVTRRAPGPGEDLEAAALDIFGDMLAEDPA